MFLKKHHDEAKPVASLPSFGTVQTDDEKDATRARMEADMASQRQMRADKAAAADAAKA